MGTAFLMSTVGIEVLPAATADGDALEQRQRS